MSDLLPHNATAQERALSEAVSRISAVPVPIRDIWDADTCPPHLLAWLAWAFSVDQWDSTWTDSQQREFIKRSIEIHRYKGTIGAVREALRALSFDAQVQEWFNQVPAGDPYTFRLLLTVDQIGIDQAALAVLLSVVRRTKNLRSHISNIEVTAKTQASLCIAGTSAVGSEIVLTGYFSPVTVLNDTALIF